MSKESDKFRELVIEQVSALPSDAPLFLSGGVDSGTLLAAFLAIGRKPLCCTFKLGDYESADYLVSKDMCETFGLPFIPVTVPRNVDLMYEDCKKVIWLTGSSVKTHVQCSWPFLHMCRELRSMGYSTAAMGMAVDDLWGTGRDFSIAYRNGGDYEFTKERERTINDPSVSDHSVMRLCRKMGVDVVDCYRQKPIIDYMLSLRYDQLHNPSFKGLALLGFSEFWRKKPWYRNPEKQASFLQVVSGIREFHDVLLTTPYNKNKHKAVVGIYNDIKKEVL